MCTGTTGHTETVLVAYDPARDIAPITLLTRMPSVLAVPAGLDVADVAGFVAKELGIGRILIPRDPGTFSAWGMLVTDVRQDRSVTRLTALDTAVPADIEALFAEMERGVRDDLAREGFAGEREFGGSRHAGEGELVEPRGEFIAAGPGLRSLSTWQVSSRGLSEFTQHRANGARVGGHEFQRQGDQLVVALGHVAPGVAAQLPAPQPDLGHGRAIERTLLHGHLTACR